jgi:hypothetical protein
MSKDTIKVNMNIYDIPILVEQLKKLEQENKQLKSILTELEEYLVKITKNGASIEKITCSNILVYLKELKEKYKC